VLEHIPDLDPVLKEMHRVLQPGARFVFCVPNHRFTAGLSTARFFERLGWDAGAEAYRGFFNRISRHEHTDGFPRWKERLVSSGFEIEDSWHYFSPAALKTLEWGHYFGLPALAAKVLFGRWILVRDDWNLSLTRRVVSGAYREDPVREDGAYTFYLTRRL
jgi:SAM-dependent methyltransferase